METFRPTALKKLIDFYTKDNIISLRYAFIGKWLEDNENFYLSDEDRGIVSIDNMPIHDQYGKECGIITESLTFESELREKLQILENELKSEILSSNILLSQRQKKEYWKKILDSFDRFFKNNPEFPKLFPSLYYLKINIKNFLQTQFDYNQTPETFTGSSYFRTKQTTTKKKLNRIYDFLINKEYINDEQTSEDEFCSILNDLKTDYCITFMCSTEMAAVILKLLEPLFDNLNPTEIEKSRRFKSKKGKVLTSSNLYKSFNKAKNNNSSDYQEITNFFKDNL
jgi:hypothetical protein